MKKSFAVHVSARTPDQAWEQSRAAERYGKRGYKLVTTTPAEVRATVVAKRRRAVENGALYADKVAEYDGILARFDAMVSTKPGLAVMLAMLEHGDSRTDNQAEAAVICTGPGKYAVFGYTFG